MRGCAIREPWPIQPILRSRWRQVYSIRLIPRAGETEDLGADALTSNTLLQWTAQTDFLCVVRLFELNCCAIPIALFGARQRSVRSCTPFRFLWGEFYQDFCRPRKPAGNCFLGSRRVHPVLDRRTAATHSSVGPLYGIDSRSLITRPCARAPTFRPVGVLAKVDCSSGQAQTRTLTGGRVRSGSGCGNNETGVQRGFQRRRIRKRRAAVARRPCSGGAHSVHPSWIPWCDHSSARGESAEDQMTHPQVCGSWKRHAEEHPLHRCGNLRSLRKVIGSVAGGCVRQHPMRCQIYGLFETSPIVARYGNAAALEAAKTQLKPPTAEATPRSRTSTLSTTTTARKSKSTLR